MQSFLFTCYIKNVDAIDNFCTDNAGKFVTDYELKIVVLAIKVTEVHLENSCDGGGGFGGSLNDL